MRILALAALLVLAACDEAAYEEHMARVRACQAAETYGAMFGTPDDRGPCWGPIMTVSHGYGLRYYHMRTVTGGQAIVMYDGDELISVTLG